MNSSTSGWSTSSTTIFAARRVFPPDPVEDGLHRVLDREDEAGRALWLLLEADVEPDRAVERGVLVDEDRLQLGLERLGLLVVEEVAALGPPGDCRVDDPADH